ncbi:unnamed protein product [Fraxinus pennsylvanica]|uniref:Uncharacterized protein n=1 Tax=Fraxinus pennsylvanica TaxID=56036 RepID=A0AAD1Z7E7_9LAMI|nr:unnamed protein product [Fraxinus pennsylvanica]
MSYCCFRYLDKSCLFCRIIERNEGKLCGILENPKYGKFKDNTEIFHTYSKLFGDTQDSTKYALTPTKLSQRGLYLSSDSDAEDRYDTVPINAETTDSSERPVDSRVHSSMNISLSRSGEKRKGKQSKGKGKKKKFRAREVSESVDNLVTVSREFTSVLRSRDKGVMTISECVKDLLSTGLVQSGDELHLFALWWFRDNDNVLRTVPLKHKNLGSPGLSTASNATRMRIEGSR